MKLFSTMNILLLVFALAFSSPGTIFISTNQVGILNKRWKQFYCQEGYRLDVINGDALCRMCNVCPLGQGVLELCTENKQTVCGDCTEGYFSSVINSVDACHICDSCEINILEECTSTNDTVCNQICPPETYWSSSLSCKPCDPRCKPEELELIKCENNQNRYCDKRLHTISDMPITSTSTSTNTSKTTTTSTTKTAAAAAITTEMETTTTNGTPLKISLERKYPIRVSTANYPDKHLSTEFEIDLEGSELPNPANKSSHPSRDANYAFFIFPVVIFIFLIVICRKLRGGITENIETPSDQVTKNPSSQPLIPQRIPITDMNSSTSHNRGASESTGGIQGSTTRLVTQPELLRLANNLGAAWQSLAINLGLSNDDIYKCKADNPHNTNSQIFAMLCLWQSKENKNATVGNLCRKLKEERDIDHLAYNFFITNSNL